MKKLGLMIVILAGLYSCQSYNNDENPIRVTEKFTSDWKFYLGEEKDAWQTGFDDTQWQLLSLPHDWSISEPYNKNNPGGHGTSFMIGGIGWYRKTFHLPVDLGEKRVEITFDGVYQNSTVWINGYKLGTRPFGYITFKYDLTPHLVAGKENVIAVRVDNSDQPNSRWYSGSGIYRNVWLTITDKLHIDPWGLFITTPEISENRAKVRIESKINNHHDKDEAIIVLWEILLQDGKSLGKFSSDH